MWRSCSFSQRSKATISPSRLRAATTETSRSKATKPSRIIGAEPERAVNRGDVGALADQRLALAVVTEPPGLEDRGTAEFGDRAHQRARILDADEGRDLVAEIAQEGLFRQPVLGQRQSPGARTDWHALRKKFKRRCRHVLPLEGDDVDASAKRASAASSSNAAMVRAAAAS